MLTLSHFLNAARIRDATHLSPLFIRYRKVLGATDFGRKVPKAAEVVSEQSALRRAFTDDHEGRHSTRPSRSPATGSIDIYPGGTLLHW